MQIDKKAIKNILVIRNDRFGEFLLNIPAFRALKETFINARIIAVVNPYVEELAESIPFIDEVIKWGMARHSLPEKLRLISLLSKKDINIVLMLNPSREFNIITYLCGIPVRAGYDRKWGFLLTHKIKDEKYLGNKHEVEYNLELAGLVGAKTSDLSLSLNIDEKSECFSRALIPSEARDLKDSIALHPWTSDPVKQWPVENFFKLAKRITQELNMKIVVVGAKEQAGRELFREPADKIINITGKTTLRQLATVLKQCRLLISADSGPVHLACAVNTRVLAIFRNDIPGKSAKRWGPWGKGHMVIEKNNLYDISVDEVFDKVKVMLLSHQ